MTTFRADQVGSLLRPQALLDARAAHADGELDDAGLRAAEDAAIRRAIAMQEAAGIDADLTEIVRREVDALAAEAVPYIQLDNPRYTRLVDEHARAELLAEGIDPERELDEMIASDNRCVATCDRAGRTLAIHLCRGNSRSRWMHEGGYERIAEKLFHSLDFDTLLLEYDDERSGGFEPLRFVPPDKVVVLGLVSSKGAELEDRDALERRIEEAARHMPLERLALSPQCGFASVAAGNLLTEDDQRRKLELIAETAARVWG